VPVEIYIKQFVLAALPPFAVRFCFLSKGQAEPLLLESYEVLKTKLGNGNEQTQKALERIEKFNQALSKTTRLP
jgi:hypothetical protein